MRLTKRCRYCGSPHKPPEMPQCNHCWSVSKSLYCVSLWGVIKMWWDSRGWRIDAINWWRRMRGEETETDD